MGLGWIGMGRKFAFRQGGESWSSYWTQRSSLLYIGRSGDELTESKSGLNASIIGCPVMKFTDDIGAKGTVIGYADNGAFDIDVTGEITLSAWIRVTDAAATAPTYILGKLIAANVNGRYGIYYSTDTKFSVQCYDTGAKVIAATAVYTPNTWYHLILTIKENDKMHFYINNVEQGAGVAVGAFNAVDNKYRFFVGAANASTGNGDINRPFSGGNIYDVRLFDHIITAPERASIMAGTIIGDEKAFYPLLDYYNTLASTSARWFDISGNGRHLSNQGEILVNQYEFIANSAFHCIDNGFSIWGDPQHATDYDNYVCVPYGMTGSALSLTPGTDVPTGYSNLLNVPGNATKLNSFPCLLDFDPDDTLDSALDIFDRSNATIHNVVSRASAYYDASNPYRFGSLELNINVLKTFFEPDYLWMLFPKMSSNSVYRDERIYFDEIAVFATQLNTTYKIGILKYTEDYDLFYSMVYTESTTTHISAQRGNAILYCDDAGTLSISTDGGASILRTLDVSADLSKVVFAHIWANGNINFGYGDAMYLSTDNLQTYSTITVLDVAGNPYSNVGITPFHSLMPPEIITYNGTELLIWGCYTTEAGVENVDVNIWFSNDNGVSLKSIYKFGTTLPLAQARHVHGVHYCSDTGYFWITTGDDTYLGDNECHWIRGTYNGSAFAWTVIVSDDGAKTATYVKVAGMHFYNGYCYFGLDKTGTTVGIWKCLYADMGDNTKYTQLTGYGSTFGASANISEMIFCQGVPGANLNTLAVSVDSKHFQFETYTIVGFVVSNNYNYIGCHKNTTGNRVLDFSVAGETIIREGPQLLVRINKNN